MLASMLVEQVLPMFVHATRALPDCLLAEAKVRGLSIDQAKSLFSIVPEDIMRAGCFFDKITDMWRYEFGRPYKIGGQFLWGTDMWIPVHYLLTALLCVQSRLSESKQTDYLARLADSRKHQDVLVEMIPADKVGSVIPVEFEVTGVGAGNCTVDWLIGHPSGRIILLDVKRRVFDFIRHVQETAANVAEPEPDHDPTLLFRSVERKFKSTNPDLCLQGVWLVTHIAQNEDRVFSAFSELDASKVHFAILGDWKPDAYVLARRDEDREYLKSVFRLQSSARFSYKGAARR